MFNCCFSVHWRAVLAGLLLAGLAGGAWFWPRDVTTPGGSVAGHLPFGVRPSDLNLLIITLDTTRADRIGAYSRGASATPALDRIARDGIVFERAFAPAPLTLPSHASLFTARNPPAHGVRDNGGFVLDPRASTLAERLKAEGLLTGAFVGAYVVDRRWGIGQGFDTYFDEFDLTRRPAASLGAIERPGNEVADRALRWLEGAVSARFFAWVHFYDPHSPYDAPEPYRSKFGGRPYMGEIAFVDAQVERLLAFLERRGVLQRTVVVVIGDHGESLGEHGEETHGFFVYQSVLHVPLLMLSPFDAMRGRRVSDLVRTIDVMPTVLDLLGIGAARDDEGRSLVPLMTGTARELGLAAYAEAMYPRFHYGWSELRAVTSGRFKYIDAPRPELYDLEQDPLETRNLYAERRTLGERMAAEVRAVDNRSGPDPTPAVEIDPDARARLAALGYVATFIDTPAVARSQLADPKDKIEVFNLIMRARELLQPDGDADAGLASLHQVVQTDPAVIDAWLMIGNELMRRRQFSAALENYKRALALKPDYDLAMLNAAKAYRALGRKDAALAGYRALLQSDADHTEARQEMAQVLIEQDRLVEAEQELRTVLARQPAMWSARNSLGALRLKQGDIAGGEREILAALEHRPNLPLAHFNLALVAEQRGDMEGAASEYQKEIALHPDNYMAHFNLGKIHERRGDSFAQRDAYRRSIEANPAFAEGHLFLAKLQLDLGDLEEAIRLARRGIDLAPDASVAPLGHFVLADVYSRQGRTGDAAREEAMGRRLQLAAKNR